MERLASLQKRASDLRRTLFASQSLSVRIAAVYFTLITGSDSNPLLESIGRGLGAVFILKGVTGLPDVRGKSAQEFLESLPEPKRDVNSLIARLPPHYLDSFAVKIRNAITSKFKSEDLAKRAISQWLPRFILGGWKGMHEGVAINAAASYIMSSIQREGMNVIRHDRGHKYDRSLDEQDEEGHTMLNLADPHPSALDLLESHRDRPVWESPKVRRILETKVHPDAPKFLDLRLEGKGIKEITGDPKHGVPGMLPHYDKSYEHWQFHVMPKIFSVLKDLAEHSV